MKYPLRILLLGGLAVFSGCILPGSGERDDYSFRYFPGHGAKDTTYIWVFPNLETPGDTLRDTVPGLVIYPADSVLFRYRHEHHAPSGVADGDYGQTVLFAVTGDGDEFRIDSAHPGKVYFQDACFGDCGVQTVVSADIEGERRGTGKYWVKGTVVYDRTAGIPGLDPQSPAIPYFRDTVTFEGTFSKASGSPD